VLIALAAAGGAAAAWRALGSPRQAPRTDMP